MVCCSAIWLVAAAVMRTDKSSLGLPQHQTETFLARRVESLVLAQPFQRSLSFE